MSCFLVTGFNFVCFLVQVYSRYLVNVCVFLFFWLDIVLDVQNIVVGEREIKIFVYMTFVFQMREDKK